MTEDPLLGLQAYCLSGCGWEGPLRRLDEPGGYQSAISRSNNDATGHRTDSITVEDSGTRSSHNTSVRDILRTESSDSRPFSDQEMDILRNRASKLDLKPL